ncbi:MAG: hypothetical protein IJP25_02895 [Elusimicrobiaceae bacterium]|nr:hypothetical protein [Elusimicrobiaceae bacterium]
MSPKICPRCFLPYEETDNFCRRCGKSLKPGSGFLCSHTGIILLILVLGPFALPVVWSSKLIGTVAKWIYTIVLVLIGIYLIQACVAAFELVQDVSRSLVSPTF